MGKADIRRLEFAGAAFYRRDLAKVEKVALEIEA
jgi:hypothetical protein